jgi:hypothetical protein
VQKIDNATWVAIAVVVAGWFCLNTLVATFGPIQHSVHFYELPSAMKDPRWLLYGVGQSASLTSIVFAIVCLGVIGAPLVPRIGLLPQMSTRVAWLMSSAPLLLMVLCGVTLYVKSSTAHIEAMDSLGRVGDYLARFANGATRWGGDVVARHIAIGAGSYASFIASGFLAVKGVLSRRPAIST